MMQMELEPFLRFRSRAIFYLRVVFDRFSRIPQGWLLGVARFGVRAPLPACEPVESWKQREVLPRSSRGLYFPPMDTLSRRANVPPPRHFDHNAEVRESKAASQDLAVPLEG